MNNKLKSATKKPFIVKSLTNEGIPCKQYFRLIQIDENVDTNSLLIEKRILVEKENIEGYLSIGYMLKKHFKTKSLLIYKFGIKLSTLSQVTDWMNSLPRKIK